MKSKFELFQTFETRDRAEEVCNRHDSTLVTIKSADEQKYLTEYILKSSDSHSIWIGAVRRLDRSTDFEWNDGSAVQRFKNWAIGRPSDDVRRTCGYMVPSILLGTLSELEWVDVGCTAGSWFICEKLQTWPFHNFQQAILNTWRELQNSVEDFADQMTNLRNNLTIQLKELQENPIPIGFIYVQLPNQPEPRNIWPTVQWIEISQEYAGLFFRVLGGDSAAFGTLQFESSPRLLQVRQSTLSIVDQTAVNPNNVWSQTVRSGIGDGGLVRGLQFLQSSGEVRPRNHAVRIWRRAT